MIGLAFLLLLLVTTSAASNNCGEIRDVDVIFEIPEIGKNEALEEAKTFIKTLGKKAAKSCWRPRVRVAGSQVHHINSFDCYSTECMSEGIGSLNQELSRTITDSKEAVMTTLRDMKREAYEAEVVPGLDGPRRVVLLVLSSKPKYNTSRIPDSITELLEGGYDFIAIGVGEGRNEDLQRIAFLKNRVVDLEKFTELNTNNEHILDIIDHPDRPDPPEEIVQKDYYNNDGEVCKYIADIAFLIDSSGSVRHRTDYKLMKQFVVQIASRFNISKDGARAGVVVFSDRGKYTRTTVKLNDYYTNDGFKKAIEKSPYMGYRTRIDLALKLTKEEVFIEANGARNNVNKLVFLLTDGKQNPVTLYDPIELSRNLLKDGVKIFAVGITRSIDHEQLEAIAGEAERVYYLEQFHQLASKQFLRKVAGAGCRAGSLPKAQTVEVDARPTTTTTTTPIPTTKASTEAPKPTGCAIEDHKQCKIYKDDKEGYCIRNWLKVNCKYLCGICEYEDTSCEIKDKEACAQYSTNIEAYCVQPWMKANCRHMCGICVDEEELTTPAPTEPAQVDNTGVNTGGKGVGNCASCCHGHNVYLNIFRAGTGPNYVLQGMRLKPNGKSLTGVPETKGPRIQITTEGKPISMDKFFKVLKEYLPGKPQIVKTIKQIVESEKKEMTRELPTTTLVHGVPSMVARDQGAGEKKRKRRSVADIDSTKRLISKLAKNAGCKLFLSALEETGILHQINLLLKDKKEVIIFCPIDTAFERIYRTKSSIAAQKEILLNHIAVKHDTRGTMYKTLLPGGRIVLNPTGKNGEVSWTANGVEVMLALTDGMGREVILTKDVIYPKTQRVVSALKSHQNLSMFYEIFRRSRISDIFKTEGFSRVCFEKDLCVRLSRSMKEHMKEVISFNQFSIIAPTNAMFDGMKKAKLKSLMMDSQARLNFLQEHVFLGSLADSDAEHRGIAYSVSPLQSVLTMNNENGERYLVHSDKRLLLVKETVPLVEGTLYIVEMQE